MPNISTSDDASSPLARALRLLAPCVVVAAWLLSVAHVLRASTSSEEFVVGRALADLRFVLGDGSPHPVASPANVAVRERIRARLSEIGYSTAEQRAFACGEHGTCADVVNVVARLDGDGAGPTVMLTAHYDSVAAGPGASDDGIGVAVVLECARVLREEKDGPSVLFLLTDGEEAGLLGARAFATSERFASVAAVVNVEARGTSGPALMFETSDDNGALIREVVSRLPDIRTSSLLADVYGRLANSTDLTVYKRAGRVALNFGIIGHASRYHTVQDDVAHVDRASVGHLGSQALASIRALRHVGGRLPPRPNMVFFDVLGVALPAWPSGASIGISAALAIALSLFVVRLRRASRLRVRDMAAVPLLSAGASLLALAAALGATALVRVLANPSPDFPVTPWVLVPTALGIALALNAAVAAIAERLGSDACITGVALTWGISALATSVVLPAVSFMAIVPFAFAVVGSAAFFVRRSTGREIVARAAASVGAALASGGVVAILPVAVGRDAFPLSAALGCLSLGPAFVPLVAGLRRRFLVPGAVGVLIAILDIGHAVLAERSTVDDPLGISLAHVQAEGSGEALLVHGDSTFVRDALVSITTSPSGRWAETNRMPASDLPAPVAKIASAETMPDGRVIRVTLHSRRSATALSLLFPGPRPRRAIVRGETLPIGEAPMPPEITIRSPGDEPVLVEIWLDGKDPVEAFVVDETPGLPEPDARKAGGRPDFVAPVDDGDRTLVGRRIVL